MIVHSAGMNALVKRSGITLTEILIAIMIMGIGMVSLATLFPLGLLKLRDAARFSRSAYLVESASADLAVRGLLNPVTLGHPDTLNSSFGLPMWYVSPNAGTYNPLVQDTPSYGGDWTLPGLTPPTQGAQGSTGAGLPFAFDPLWRWQTVWNSEAIWGISSGIYLDPLNQFNQGVPEARFASGIGFIRNDPGDNGLPSAHGLQRLTSFNIPSATIGGVLTPIMPMSQFVPSIFVSPEDMVWQDPDYKGQYSMGGSLALLDPFTNSRVVDSSPSALVPDLNQSSDSLPIFDWRYSWMFTGRQISSGSAVGATFDGDIVIFENRPFALDTVLSPITNRPVSQIAGEQVVEAVFGYSSQVIPTGTDQGGHDFGYGAGASKSVLLRWPAAMTDPEIKVGGWIADVTYERRYSMTLSRFALDTSASYVAGSPSLSGQRCHWYQVVKINPPEPAVGNLAFGLAAGTYRSMIVNVATPLRAYTQLNATNGWPIHVNAALVSPYVVQVIPRTFTVN